MTFEGLWQEVLGLSSLSGPLDLDPFKRQVSLVIALDLSVDCVDYHPSWSVEIVVGGEPGLVLECCHSAKGVECKTP